MKEILTPCILQTIIICCTFISLAMIGVSACRVRKEKEEHDSGTYIFITSSIVFIAITIFSYAFYQSDTILSFISLASSLISIILAVVTIIYSFYTNNNSSNQVKKLNDAADVVMSAAGNVKTAATLYNESAESLQDNIKKIISAIERVEQKTDQILNTNMTSSSKGNNDLSNFNLTKFIENYIDLSSRMGIMTLYACVKSCDLKKPFTLSLLGDHDTELYTNGYIIASRSAGLISAIISKISDESNEKYIVKISNYESHMKKYINIWISNNQEKFDYIKMQKTNIDEYFDNNVTKQ